MAVESRMLSKFLALILIYSIQVSVSRAYYVEQVRVEDCKTGGDEEYHEYFDISQLLCAKCSQTALLQTVTEDGEWHSCYIHLVLPVVFLSTTCII